MGKRDRYEPGTFCWVDLATTDPAAAKAFYGELFGWEAEDMPAGEAATYTMMEFDGDTICGLYEMDDERKSQNAPPYWLSYISVEDAGEAAAKARELGGEVIEEAFDVMDSGRMAVISDPGGATVPLWQPKAHIGASRVNDTGCLAWNELQTRDHGSASSFYGNLFGWKMSPIEKAETRSTSPSRTKAP
ncbi:MAG: VOC family protein [Rubrobacteraceae bacterium]